MSAAPTVLVDIEGTIADIAFVKDVLFPYARRALPEFVQSHGSKPEIRRILDAAADEGGVARGDDTAIIQILIQWIDQDIKATPLKALQGKIWFDGYSSGAFTAHLYADAYRQLKAWREAGVSLNVYSSGSVEAQDLYFGHTEYGDIRGWFDHFFDTNVGHKKESGSYASIADSLGCAPASVVFFSDVTDELNAAASAGMRAVLIARYGQEPGDGHAHFTDFSDIDIEAL